MTNVETRLENPLTLKELEDLRNRLLYLVTDVHNIYALAMATEVKILFTGMLNTRTAVEAIDLPNLLHVDKQLKLNAQKLPSLLQELKLLNCVDQYLDILQTQALSHSFSNRVSAYAAILVLGALLDD